jgi:hypothetical protein
MSKKIEGQSIKEKREARNNVMVQALTEFNTNVLGLIVTDTASTRYLKLFYRADGTWLAIAGAISADDEDIVVFGNGDNALGALYILGRAMANDEWRIDKFSERNKKGSDS